MSKYNIIGIRYNKSDKATHFAVSALRNKKPPTVEVVSREDLVSNYGEDELFVWRPKFFGKTPNKVLVSTKLIRTEANATGMDNLEFLPRI